MLLLMFSWFSVSGQNLVPNPSFEEVVKQPCNLVSFGESISNYVRNWRTPTGGTSDIWFLDSIQSNNCGQNLIRYQEKPHTGKYCAGMAVSTINVIGSRKPYREYIQVNLSKPLEVGRIYYVEWYVMLQSRARYAANNMGAFFSTEPISRIENKDNFGDLLPYTPQVNETKILLEQKKWVKISGCFEAKETYQYITIGNFYNDEQTSFVPVENNNLGVGSYYLIDDVVVREAGTDYLPTAGFLGADTTLCYNQSLTITVPDAPTIAYQGPEMAGKNKYILSQTGTYSVTATAGRCIVTDTLQLTVEQPVLLSPDTTLCLGQVLSLSPEPAGRRYVWSDGSTDSTLAISQSGQYWARVQSRYCTAADTINVSFLECPGMVPNVFTPNGDGKNDYFFIKNIDLIPWRLQIFNRWGKRIYDVEAYRNEWRGDGSPVGLYYYYLSSQRLNRQLKGWVQLIR